MKLSSAPTPRDLKSRLMHHRLTCDRGAASHCGPWPRISQDQMVRTASQALYAPERRHHITLVNGDMSRLLAHVLVCNTMIKYMIIRSCARQPDPLSNALSIGGKAGTGWKYYSPIDVAQLQLPSSLRTSCAAALVISLRVRRMSVQTCKSIVSILQFRTAKAGPENKRIWGYLYRANQKQSTS